MDNILLEKIRKIQIFEKIKSNDEYINLFLKIGKLKNYKKGDCIIKEGDMGSELFIVTKGGVEIFKRTRAGDEYTVVKLKAEHNVFFGEMALIDDDKRSATVTATEDSEFFVVEKNAFIKLGDEYPEVCLPITREISKILAGRLRKTTDDMLMLFDALVDEIKT